MSLEPRTLADIRYKCPVCFASLFPPVYQCQNGHLLCHKCIPKLNKCAVCRVVLPETFRVRSLEVERIIHLIEHPCPNKNDGCNALLSFPQLEDHIQECEYTSPFARKYLDLNVLVVSNCEEIRISDFPQHLESVHGEKFNVPWFQDTCFFRCSLTAKYKRRTLSFRISLENNPILVIVVLEFDRGSDLMTWKPYVLAGTAFTNELHSEIRLYTSNEMSVKVSLDSPVFNLQSEPEELQTCVGLPLKYLQRIFATPSQVSNGDDPECDMICQISKKD